MINNNVAITSFCKGLKKLLELIIGKLVARVWGPIAYLTTVKNHSTTRYDTYIPFDLLRHV